MSLYGKRVTKLVEKIRSRKERFLLILEEGKKKKRIVEGLTLG